MTTFVWSGDDAGMGGRHNIEAMLHASGRLEEMGVRATWFVVPLPGGKPLSAQWRDALLRVRDAGHDLQLHGLTHEDCFEFGPPVWPATDIEPAFVTQFEARRDSLMQRYTYENLHHRISQGLRIFRDELGIDPVAFRAPCGANSRPMFAALADLGLRYHSCEYISATGYDHLPHRPGVSRQVWTDRIPHAPFRTYSGIVEVPILNEYTWSGAAGSADALLDIARQDVQRIARESPVAVLLMHTHGIANDLDYATRAIRTIAGYVTEAGGEFATLAALARSGALDAAAVVEGPMDLEV